MNVTGNNISIADGDTTPSNADNTDFGTGNSVTRSFSIQNKGHSSSQHKRINLAGQMPASLP